MSSFTQGYEDAKRGHTACPHGTEKEVNNWNRGYAKAEKEGVAELPRFGRKKRRGKNK